jgi:hypothetical protein
VVRGLLLLALILAVPVIGAANPSDLLWCAGWYDDADPDELVVKNMSPDGGLGATALTPTYLDRDDALVASTVAWPRSPVHGSVSARGPPFTTVVPTRSTVHLPRFSGPPPARLARARSPPPPARRLSVRIDCTSAVNGSDSWRSR